MATDQKLRLSHLASYLIPKFSRVPITIVGLNHSTNMGNFATPCANRMLFHWSLDCPEVSKHVVLKCHLQLEPHGHHSGSGAPLLRLFLSPLPPRALSPLPLATPSRSPLPLERGATSSSLNPGRGPRQPPGNGRPRGLHQLPLLRGRSRRRITPLNHSVRRLAKHLHVRNRPWCSRSAWVSTLLSWRR